MAPPHNAARTEREKKLKAVIAFASNLATRFNASRDATLVEDVQTQIRALPLQASSTVTARQDELDRLGTELWNLSTRLRRDETQLNGKTKEEAARKNRALCLLRVFAFLLLDSANGQSTKGRQPKACVRLMKVALKAAKVCIEEGELSSATKVLERAADYQEALTKDDDRGEEEEAIGQRLRVEYYAMRTTLAWRQGRMDTAEHMFTKCKELSCILTPSTAESFSDLLYEVGKDALEKRNYELAVRWLERAHDILGEQDLEMLSLEAGELRLSIMQNIAQSYMMLKVPDARRRAWHMVSLLEADYEDKMSVSLLKLELLSAEDAIDVDKFYTVLYRMIRSVVLNDRNFKTIMHHIYKLKNHGYEHSRFDEAGELTDNYSSLAACKLIDELIEIRLYREEKSVWVEKAVITRVWICCTTAVAEDILERLRELFDSVTRNTKASFSAQATHAAQTLLWKQVEATFGQDMYSDAEAWCSICLHPLFEKAGDVNKSKVARKMILCVLARHDYAAAREIFSKMPESGRDDRVTRYLMYKAGLNTDEPEFVAECLDIVCRQSSKDATLLYACVLDAQASGNRKQAIAALQKVLDKYDHSAPADVHLPALLRLTTRLLMQDLVKDSVLDSDILNQVCKIFEGACTQAKASRRRPSTATRDQFTSDEFAWFSKNAYNLSIKYCAEMQPQSLVRLLSVCVKFIKLFREHRPSEDEADLSLRTMFCNFLATCAFTTLARAENNIQDCLQYYLQARKQGREFRSNANQNLDKLGDSAKVDIIAKHFQIVKLELEAALKLEQWDELDELFDLCWKYEDPDHYETLADLVLVIHSCIMKANLDGRYQSKILAVLQKIINMAWKQTGNDIVKLTRWIRCLFQLALTYDESISLKCVEQAIDIAAKRQGTLSYHATIHTPNTPPPTSSPLQALGLDALMTDEYDKGPNHYPATELEWLATTTFNHAVDHYIQEDDKKCKEWGEKALQLASWAEDDGARRDILMQKFSGLTWNDGE